MSGRRRQGALRGRGALRLFLVRGAIDKANLRLGFAPSLWTKPTRSTDLKLHERRTVEPHLNERRGGCDNLQVHAVDYLSALGLQDQVELCIAFCVWRATVTHEVRHRV